MAYGTVNADVIGTSVANTSLGAGNASIMKNRIINGAMVIDQRNAGASVTPNNSYTLDRWIVYNSQTGKLTVQQNAGSVTPPVAFTNYLGVTSSSAYSVSSSDYFQLQQGIEGYNFADLGFGTANAKTITVSFWVRSSLTGTFVANLANADGTRWYPFSYTISSANTWTQISTTIAGDTTGTWVGATNGMGIRLVFVLGYGSSLNGTIGAWGSTAGGASATSVVGTNGATFYITGVQLEVGSSATGYEYVNYQTSLANCQRYYQKSFPIGTAPAQNAGITGAVFCQGQAASAPAYAYTPFQVRMRATPGTVATYNPSAVNGNWRNISTNSDINAAVYSSGDSGVYIKSNTQVLAQYNDAAIHFTADAEL